MQWDSSSSCNFCLGSFILFIRCRGQNLKIFFNLREKDSQMKINKNSHSGLVHSDRGLNLRFLSKVIRFLASIAIQKTIILHCSQCHLYPGGQNLKIFYDNSERFLDRINPSFQMIFIFISQTGLFCEQYFAQPVMVDY